MFLNVYVVLNLKKNQKPIFKYLFSFFSLFQVNWDTAYGKVGHKLVYAYNIHFLKQDIVQIKLFKINNII